jgi:hypothetical protein
VAVNFLIDENISFFVDKLQFDDMTIEMWPKVIQPMNRISDDELRSIGSRSCRVLDQPKNIQFHSKVLSDFPAIVDDFRMKK